MTLCQQLLKDLQIAPQRIAVIKTRNALASPLWFGEFIFQSVEYDFAGGSFVTYKRTNQNNASVPYNILHIYLDELFIEIKQGYIKVLE